MMKRRFTTVINPNFSFLSSFVESVPGIFDHEGEVVYKARNEIKTYQRDGLTLNVKSYKIPIFINKIAYSLLRPTKARRAYEYALKLISLGVETPEPVAYIEERRHGLLYHSYFISLHTPLQGNLRIFSDENVKFDDVRDLAIAFGRYTAALHEKGVLHVDYSPGNILYQKNPDETYRFSLIDINRMKFPKEIDMRMGCQNFCRLYAGDEFFETVGKAYAAARGFDEKKCISLIMEYRNKEWEKRERKYRIKKRMGKAE